jgi:hypothetical protein
MLILRNIAFNIRIRSLIPKTNSQLVFQCFVISSIDLSIYTIYCTCYNHTFMLRSRMIHMFPFIFVFLFCFPLVLAFDFFYLSFQCPDSFCNTNSSSQCSNIPPYFTICGLLPQLVNDLPINCPGTPPFNHSVVYIYCAYYSSD